MVTEGGKSGGGQEGEIDKNPVDELASRRLERSPKTKSRSISVDFSILPYLQLEADISKLPSEELIDLQERLNIRIEHSKKAKFESMSPMDRMNK